MYPPTAAPFHFFDHHEPLPDCFNLLVWNLHKVPLHTLTLQKFEALLSIPHRMPIHLLSLQEVSLPLNVNHFMNLNFAMAANLQTKKSISGVLTASSQTFKKRHALITQKKELGFATYKSILITEHPIANGEKLLHINVHAMVFVSFNFFYFEISRLHQKISEHQGPLIVSGDFNSWSRPRFKFLQNFFQQFNLNFVEFKAQQNIKKLGSNPLDQVYYRGLKLINASALNIKNISDHNPLIVQFCTCPKH